MKWKSLVAGVLCAAMLVTTALAAQGTLPQPFHAYTPGVPSALYVSSFRDVKRTDWFYDAVMTLTQGGLLAGYGNGSYGRNDPLTPYQAHIIRHPLVSSPHHLEQSPLPAASNGFDPAADNQTADRAFTLILFMDAAMWGSVYLQDSTLTRDSQVTEFRNLVGDSYDVFAKNGVVVNNTRPENTVVSMSFYQPIYDTVYAKAVQGQTIRTIRSISDLPDGAEIDRWLEEHAGTMRTHLGLSARTSLADVKAYCEKLIVYGCNIGLFSGVDHNGTFAPYAPITRGQIAQALFNTGWSYSGCIAQTY